MTMSKSYKYMLSLGLAGLALGLAGWFAAGQAAADTNHVWIEPANVSVPLGGSVTVSLMAEVTAQSGIPPTATGGLGSWDFNIGYDDEVLTATACTSITGGGCRTDMTTSDVRLLGFVGIAYEGVQTLGTITFDVKGESGESSPVIITYTSFNNSNGDPTNPEMTNGTIIIQPLGSTSTPVATDPALPPASQIETPSAGTAALAESRIGTPGTGTAAPDGGEIQLPAPGSGDGSAGGGLSWIWLLLGAVGAAAAGGMLFFARAKRLADRRKAGGPNGSG